MEVLYAQLIVKDTVLIVPTHPSSDIKILKLQPTWY